MKVTEVSRNLVRFLEFITLLTLFGSGELRVEAFISSLIAGFSIFLVSRYLGLKNGILKDQTLLYGLIITGAASIYIIKHFHFAPLEMVPYSLIAVQTLIWFMRPSTRNMSWRLALTFLMLVLAAALTPDFFMAGVILLYLLICSVCLLTLFFESELIERNRFQELKHFPKGLLLQSAGLALLVFLMSLVLFPILPRMNSFTESKWTNPLPGYAEQVGTSGGVGFGRTTNREIALKIEIPSQLRTTPLEKLFPYGLLRSRVLSVFDGKKWTGRPLLPDSTPANKADVGGILLFERQRLHTEVLPVPYGSAQPRLMGEFSLRHLRQSQFKEWFHLDAADQIVRYQVPVDTQKNDESSRTAPTPVQLPDRLDSAFKLRLLNLSNQIFNSPAKLHAPGAVLKEYFKNGLFTSSMDTDSDPSLENFLFNSKKGHCEQFATASALILIARGIPARIVSGFRIIHPAQSGMLIIREEDAHAWLEYWNQEKTTWLPLDLTPPSSKGWFQGYFLRELRDRLEAVWFQNIVSYAGVTDISVQLKKSSFQSRFTELKSFEITDKITAGFLLAIFTAFLLLLLKIRTYFLRRKPSLYIPLQSKEKIRSLKGLLNLPVALIPDYEFLRFGPLDPATPEWKRRLKKLIKDSRL